MARRSKTHLLAIRIGVGAVTLASLGACGFPKTVDGPPPVVTAEIAEREAKARPGTSLESLSAGRDLFAAKCNGCHGYPDLATVSEAKWPEILTRMGKKSDLSEAQTAQVLAFVRATVTKGR
ncbi:MAG: hypothetical protein U0169_10875 [Polyangiaceae bacterium]